MTTDELRSWSDEVLATSPALWAPGLPDVAQAVRELLKELDRLRDCVEHERERVLSVAVRVLGGPDNEWAKAIALMARVGAPECFRDTAPEVPS